MVKKMNKNKLIDELSKKINLSKKESEESINILENYFFFKKNKNADKIIMDLSEKLKTDMEKAKEIYEVSLKIINDEIKEKIKHPFKSKN